MTLENFIKKYIAPNSIVRLWVREGNVYVMINYDCKGICMEWEILDGKVYQSVFKNCKVLFIKDIVCDNNKEAINIIIDVKDNELFEKAKGFSYKETNNNCVEGE